MQVMMKTQRAAAVVLLALLAALATVSSTSGAVTRMQLSHTDAGRGLTPGELLQRMALRSKTRAARFLLSSSSSSSATVSAVPGNGEYQVSFAIGTPPQPLMMVIDTGSDLIWTQCQPCRACYDQDLPYFDMSNSSTFVRLPCNSSTCQQLPLLSCGTARGGWGNQTCVYTYSYGDKSVTNGLLAADTFTFDNGEAAARGGAATDDGLAFGCGFFNQGLFDFNSTGTGIVGFGRGALSLPSQLKVDNFSYCFTNMTGSTPSPVLLGLPANLYGGGATGVVQTTPLIVRPSSSPSRFYYLNLTSITVGSTTLKVPASAFALNADGTGGTIIDSGTSITALPAPVFGLLRDAFVSQLNMTPVAVTSLPGFLCFPASSHTATAMPTLQLQFDGATMDLPQENYVFTFQEDENGPCNVCIAMQSTPDGLSNLTIIGNYQQQNMHILYDLAGNKLSFVPAHCDMV